MTISADDTTVGGTPDVSVNYTLTLTDMNEAPTGVVLQNTTTSLAENTSTAARVKVANIVVTDDALGINTLALSGTDAASFEIFNGGLYVKAGTVLNFETKSSYAVTVSADDTTVGGTPDASVNFTLNLTDVNEAPTAIVLLNTTTPLAENASTVTATKVADIVVTDDALGTNTFSLSGTDAAVFEIVGNALRLKAGVALNYETKSSYAVTISADDTTVGGTPDVSVNYTLTLTDVNEAPTAIVLQNTTTSLAENASTVTAIKLADIVVTDDALGTNTFSLSGTDAAVFEIVGNALRLKAGVALNFETKSSYAVTISADDTTVGGTPDVSVNYTLTLTDMNEAPTTIVLQNMTTSLAENTSTASRVKVADIVVADDALGINTLVLSGGDAASFEIFNGGLYVKAGTVLNFETKSNYAVTISADDTTVGGTPDVSVNYTLTLTDVNEAPTTIVLQNTTTSLAENASTVTAIKLADIVVADDALGINTLVLSGGDAASFEIFNGGLYVKAGTVLNFETKSSYAVTVSADDTTVGGTPDVSVNYTLTLTDVNEAPTTIVLQNMTTSLAENTSTVTATKVADIVVTDDALGTNTFSLSGVDAAVFEIVGTELRLKSGIALNFEGKSSYSVTVNVDDASVGGNPDASVNYTLNLTDVNEVPTAIVLQNTTTSLQENTSTVTATKVADIVVTDDALGTNTFSLSGADASSFEIVNGGLYVKAGTVLNFESKSSYSVTVNVDDTTVGSTPDASVNYTLNLTDANDPPVIADWMPNQTVNDDASKAVFSMLTITDPDTQAMSAIVQITNGVARGDFTAATTAGWTRTVTGNNIKYSRTFPVAANVGATVQTAIRTLVFQPRSNAIKPNTTEATAFTITVSDGVATPVSNNATSIVTSSLNDSPTLGGTNVNVVADDNTAVSPFAILTASDADNQEMLISVTILNGKFRGDFTPASVADWPVRYTTGNDITYKRYFSPQTNVGVAAQAAFRALVFQPRQNAIKPGTTELTDFQVTVSDGVAPAVLGTGTRLTTTSVNEVPIIGGVVANQAINDNEMKAVFTTLTVSDPDTQDLLATVTISNGVNRGDFTAASTTGWTRSVSGTNIIYSRYFASASNIGAAAQAAIRNFVFQPRNVAVGTSENTAFTVTVKDGNGVVVTNSITSVITTGVAPRPADFAITVSSVVLNQHIKTIVIPAINRPASSLLSRLLKKMR